MRPFLDPGRAIKQDLFQPFAAANSLKMKQFDFMLPRFIKGIKQASLGLHIEMEKDDDWRQTRRRLTTRK